MILRSFRLVDLGEKGKCCISPVSIFFSLASLTQEQIRTMATVQAATNDEV